jgi:hypothetical protein
MGGEPLCDTIGTVTGPKRKQNKKIKIKNLV